MTYCIIKILSCEPFGDGLVRVNLLADCHSMVGQHQRIWSAAVFDKLLERGYFVE